MSGLTTGHYICRLCDLGQARFDTSKTGLCGDRPVSAMAAPTALKILNGGDYKGCEVQAGAGEEPVEEGGPVLHPFQLVFTRAVSLARPPVRAGLPGPWRRAGRQMAHLPALAADSTAAERVASPGRPDTRATGTGVHRPREPLGIRTPVIGWIASSVIRCGTGRAMLYSRINGSGSAPTARAMMRMYPRA